MIWFSVFLVVAVVAIVVVDDDKVFQMYVIIIIQLLVEADKNDYDGDDTCHIWTAIGTMTDKWYDLVSRDQILCYTFSSYTLSVWIGYGESYKYIISFKCVMS